jgi:hypothetical protein
LFSNGVSIVFHETQWELNHVPTNRNGTRETLISGPAMSLKGLALGGMKGMTQREIPITRT